MSDPPIPSHLRNYSNAPQAPQAPQETPVVPHIVHAQPSHVRIRHKNTSILSGIMKFVVILILLPIALLSVLFMTGTWNLVSSAIRQKDTTTAAETRLSSGYIQVTNLITVKEKEHWELKFDVVNRLPEDVEGIDVIVQAEHPDGGFVEKTDRIEWGSKAGERHTGLSVLLDFVPKKYSLSAQVKTDGFPIKTGFVNVDIRLDKSKN